MLLEAPSTAANELFKINYTECSIFTYRSSTVGRQARCIAALTIEAPVDCGGVGQGLGRGRGPHCPGPPGPSREGGPPSASLSGAGSGPGCPSSSGWMDGFYSQRLRTGCMRLKRKGSGSRVRVFSGLAPRGRPGGAPRGRPQPRRGEPGGAGAGAGGGRRGLGRDVGGRQGSGVKRKAVGAQIVCRFRGGRGL
jgi:hypothetical protein